MDSYGSMDSYDEIGSIDLAFDLWFIQYSLCAVSGHRIETISIREGAQRLNQCYLFHAKATPVFNSSLSNNRGSNIKAKIHFAVICYVHVIV